MGIDDIIIITGGGSIAHLTIIQAIKERVSSDCRLVYVGSTTGGDEEWFNNDPDFYRRYFLETRNIAEQSLLGKVSSVYLLLHAMYESAQIIKDLEPKVIFSIGGHSAAPMVYAAKRMKTPLVIYDENAVYERFHQKLKPYATHFLSPYSEDSSVHAYPVKNEYFTKQRIRDSVKCILFLGGTHGDRVINKLALSLAKELHDRGIKIIHQPGEEQLQKIQKKYDELGIRVKLFGDNQRLSSYMNEADLAIARADAMTLWELSANGLPTVFIPDPNAIKDHQYYNAKYLEDQSLAWIMREDAIDIDKILFILNQDLSIMSTKLLSRVEQHGDIKISILLKEFL